MPADKEFKEKYNTAKNSMVLSIRLNAKEQAVLDSMMYFDGWKNKNRYIKKKLFGKKVETKVEQMLFTGHDFDLSVLMLREIQELSRNLDYIGAVYNKSVSNLSKEGADIRKFIDATRDSHAKVLRRSGELLDLLKQIAERLEINTNHGEGEEPTMMDYSIDVDEIIADRDPMEHDLAPYD